MKNGNVDDSDRRPAVTIITPSYNQGRFIEQTLLSVKHQDYPYVEHIIVDGGSRDETLDILKQYEEKSKMRWISEPDKGQADAVNKGFALASGQIIGWLNSDDVYFDKAAIGSVVDAFRNSPTTDILYGHVAYVDEGGQIMRIQCLPSFSKGRLLRGCFLEQPGVFFRRHVMEEERLDVELQYTMDYEYWLRIVNRQREFSLLNRIVAADRSHAGRKMIAASQHVLSEGIQTQMRYGFRNTLWQRWAGNWDRYVLGSFRRMHGLMLLLALFLHGTDKLAFTCGLGPLVRSIWSQLSPGGIAKPKPRKMSMRFLR